MPIGPSRTNSLKDSAPNRLAWELVSLGSGRKIPDKHCAKSQGSALFLGCKQELRSEKKSFSAPHRFGIGHNMYGRIRGRYKRILREPPWKKTALGPFCERGVSASQPARVRARRQNRKKLDTHVPRPAAL